MIVDFHTHAFHDAVAKRAIPKIKSTIEDVRGHDVTIYSDGTAQSTSQETTSGNIDYSVVLSIATKPSQQRTINDWAYETSKQYENMIFFGTIHPDAEDWEAELERVKELGFKGIKLHPDYQGYFFDEEKMIPVYKKIRDLGLILVFHAGLDSASPNLVHATPQMIYNVLEKVDDINLVAAHLGGICHWDDVEKYLVGAPIYLDTAVCADTILELPETFELYKKPVSKEGLTEQMKRIIANHGADRIMLGSDRPWGSATRDIKFIEDLGFTKEQNDLIFGGNAKRLLGL